MKNFVELLFLEGINGKNNNFLKKTCARVSVGNLVSALVLLLIRYVKLFVALRFFNMLNMRLVSDVTLIVLFHKIYKNIDGDMLGVLAIYC